MKKRFRYLLMSIMMVLCILNACSHEQEDDFVLVKGGTFVNTKSNLYDKNVVISDFYISKYEVTQKEWMEVMENNPSEFKGDDLPVDSISWYDCIEYCNNRSLKEGLNPYYNVDRIHKDPYNYSENDDMKWTVTINEKANGYRLPTEAEWEYAAGGGQESKSYTYSGDDNIDEVAWYWMNSGDKSLTGEWSWPVIQNNKNRTKPVGSKKSNELGLYDMSGNVREWCWDWYGDILGISSGALRSWRGGGWLGDDQACETSYRGSFEANGKGSDQGFRICRNRGK